MMKKTLQYLAPLVSIAVLAVSSWWLQSGASRNVEKKQATKEQIAPSPMADFIVACLGGFRSLATEVVWFRLERLQSEGRYAELAQLGAWLTFLEPHTPEVWAYTAWNLSYNVSVMMSTPSDRWRWVESGLRLLRDDGLRMNPNSPELCREIAWLYLLKISIDTDSASYYYREKWREQFEEIEKSGNWTSLMMLPNVMKDLEKEYGKLDWKESSTAALYWACYGLMQKPSGLVEMNLMQVKFQSLMQMSKKDARFAPLTLKEMKRFGKQYPSQSIKNLIKFFAERNCLN